jgi:hypothetical protein
MDDDRLVEDDAGFRSSPQQQRRAATARAARSRRSEARRTLRDIDGFIDSLPRRDGYVGGSSSRSRRGRDRDRAHDPIAPLHNAIDSMAARSFAWSASEHSRPASTRASAARRARIGARQRRL